MANHIHIDGRYIEVEEFREAQRQLAELQSMSDRYERIRQEAADKRYREVLQAPENVEAFLSGEETMETLVQRRSAEMEKRERALEDRLWSRVYGGPEQGRKKDRFRDQLMRGKRR